MLRSHRYSLTNVPQVRSAIGDLRETHGQENSRLSFAELGQILGYPVDIEESLQIPVDAEQVSSSAEDTDEPTSRL